MKTVTLLSSLCLLGATLCPADLQTSFKDDFNREALGTDYALARGAPYCITNSQYLTTGGAGQNHMVLNKDGAQRTLPTAEEYAVGYSLTASIDLFIPANGQVSVATAGLVLNEQGGQSGTVNRILRFRGHSATHCTLQLLGGAGIQESAAMGPLATNTWHTLKVTSKKPGVYAYAFSRQGSRKPIVSGAFIQKGADVLTGGHLGIYTENAAAGAYLFDNFSVEVKKAEPMTSRDLLLFSGPLDITSAWGKLRFGTMPLQQVATCENPGFMPVFSMPPNEGACVVYGSVFHEDEDLKSKKLTDSGTDMARTKSTFDVVRATTRDGVRFENVETVFTSEPANWSFHCAIAYNSKAKEFLLLRLLADSSGFGYYAFSSPDGKSWAQQSKEPLFYDGDAMSLFWNAKSERYACVSKTLQPVPKRILDHGGVTPGLGDNSLRDRRVLSIRTSRDGLRWEPSDSMEDVWNRNKRKKSLPTEFMTMPDADDPPDLEFYSGNAFWHHDRSYMMVLNYAASPLVKGHGPQMDTEWWAGRDGLRWERPGRDVNATGAEITRITHNPMILNGMFLLHYGNHVLGMKQNRISFVGARANAEFSTLPFTMPRGDLLLNAAVPSPERAFATQQAYVRVAVLDEKGAVVPGFEAEQCLIKSGDEIDLPLLWDERSARELAGRTVSLRFYLRSANIYAVTIQE
jgi:hypothetical protein